LIQLEEEEREVNELLNRALNLDVDTEVQRQIKKTASSQAIPDDLVELRFRAPFEKIDQEQFKSDLIDELQELGTPMPTLKKLRIRLREGSVIAEIRGPIAAVNEVRVLPLTKVKVMGYMAEVLPRREVQPDSLPSDGEVSDNAAKPRAHGTGDLHKWDDPYHDDMKQLPAKSEFTLQSPDPPPGEWESRQNYLDRLRGEVANRRRLNDQMYAERAERQKQRQTREEQRLLREKQKLELEAEKLQQPSESEEDEGIHRTSVFESGAHSPEKSQGGMSSTGVAHGQMIPDAIDEFDLQTVTPSTASRAKQHKRHTASTGLDGVAPTHRDSNQGIALVHRAKKTSKLHKGSAEVLEKAPAPSQIPSSPGVDLSVLPLQMDKSNWSDQEPEMHSGSDGDVRSNRGQHGTSCVGSGMLTGAERHHSVQYGRKSTQYAGSCGASTSSSDELPGEVVEVGEGKHGFYGDERLNALPQHDGAQDSSSSSSSNSKPLHETTRVDYSEPAPCVSLRASDQPMHALLTQRTADELTQRFIEEWIEEEACSAHALSTMGGAEPALRQPTPVAAASLLTDMFVEDGASSVESDTAVAIAPHYSEALSSDQQVKTTNGFQSELRDIISTLSARSDEDLASCSSSPSGSPEFKSDVLHGKNKQQKLGVRVDVDRQDSGDVDILNLAVPKDAGPPRPPSPPPDVQSASACVTNAEETSNLIASELLEMLLSEVWAELAEKSGALPSSIPSNLEKTSSMVDGNDHVLGVDMPSGPGPPPGHLGIDTPSTVAKFVDAALEALGIPDKASMVTLPNKPINMWLPAAIAIMKQGGHIPSTHKMNTSTTGSGAHEKDIMSWLRLLADTLVEIANQKEKVDSQLLGWHRPGWRRPCHKDQAASPKSLTWESVSSQLQEAFGFGRRADIGDDIAWGGGASGSRDADGSYGFNIDEGVDALLEEIYTDEASGLDIDGDVKEVKNQVMQMIFDDLIQETAAEIRDLWSA